MTQQEMFGSAKWIAASVDNIEAAPVIRKSFELRGAKNAKLRIIGLGTFVAYLNGKRISDDLFLPMNSEYEKTEFPVGEQLTGYRVYATEYDVSSYLKEGKNTLAVLVGGGWYTGVWYGIHKIYGEKKLIFSMSVSDSSGRYDIVSDGSERWAESFVKTSDINKGESHDYTEWTDECLNAEFDDSAWGRVKFSAPLDTEYEFTECPADKEIRTLAVKEVYNSGSYRIFDVGENTSGYPIIKTAKGYVGDINVTFSEELSADGNDIDENHVHWQTLNSKVAGGEHKIFPRFTWYGFRYFKVEGECEIEGAVVTHTDVPVSSSFDSDNDVLNWTYNAFVNTQLTNMHRGTPSDCPHIERLGYTGDGQLVCKSALMTLDAKEFYAKWIQDIEDCQDVKTGRVQYTAPFYFCGGGPGGWGCAIVVVPYEFYKFYGDDTYIRKLWPGMLRFLDFLDMNSEYGVVTKFKDGVWCLGDWCTPEHWTLPTPFVNTCFYVYSAQKMIEIARIIGKEAEIPALEARIAERKKAIDTLYFNNFERDDTYCANTQGAAAFALNIGLGSEITKQKFIDFYDKLGHYDTGIFATELVTRKLFEYDRADVAYKLLTAKEPYGFGKWMEIGSTTLREYWDAERCRSFSHPMFGAVIACFYEYILGIRQEEDSAGYERVVISPAAIEGLGRANGHITTPKGKIAVSYKTENGKKIYTVSIPEGVSATLAIKGAAERKVGAGEYVIEA